MRQFFQRQDSQCQGLQVIPADGRRTRQRFIRLPWLIYADDPAWVPPLLMERRQHLSPRNPYFAHARSRFWIAYRGRQPVGRISAQIDDLHLQRYQDATGFFGMIEAENNAETFQALLNTAETWLHQQGMRRILGPFNLSINQEPGLLVDGFHIPPSIMMGHARPYYAAAIEGQGYRKAKDLLAYRVDINYPMSETIRAIQAKAAGRVRTRPLRRSLLTEDLQILRNIFEDAWSQNWGFIPFTEAEFEHLGHDLKTLVDDEMVQIAEVDGVPAAMLVALPNINEIIGDLNGRLLPFGWLKLLWRLKTAYPKSARVPLMGVRRKYQENLVGAALAFLIIEAVRAHGIRRGIQEVELSWILEDNWRMRNILEWIGGVAYKRYRIYGKDLV
ncbi:MAG: N-acetyltransferase [Desulfobacterales bacterium]|nr:MAG: N-acetyltransferase [Desulfobacterales bacterium]